MRALIIVLTLLTVTAEAKQKGLLKDLDSLGNNQAIAERSKAINGENKIRIVQNRTVDRTMRLEIGTNYDLVAGGDPYINTNNWGVQADFHFSNRFSIGVRHYETYASLSAEGERLYRNYDRAFADGERPERPSVDFPLASTLGVATFYPLYGKLNFFNLGITQFDVYVLGGLGQMQLNSGDSTTWTAGGGIGFWWSQHLTSRIEARYQGYTDRPRGIERDQGITSFSAGIGLML